MIKLRSFMSKAEKVFAIYETKGVSWKTKYNLIFSDDLRGALDATGLMPDHYDHYRSYEDDVRSFVDAVREVYDELSLLPDKVRE